MYAVTKTKTSKAVAKPLQILQKNGWSCCVSTTPWRFIPKYEVRNERGRKTIVTVVNMRMAEF